MMTDNTRYQTAYRTAKACAGEAVEALYSVYWADSFDAERLESRLAEMIAFFTRNARSLSEPHPHPKELEQQGDEIAIPSALLLVSTEVGRK
ncbi:hypothetical protein NC993_02885 [Leptolyngbya sp. NM1-A1]